MKAKRFGFFFSIKYIDDNIQTYRLILKVLSKLGLHMYKSELISKYPDSLKNHKKDGSSLVEGTQRQLRSVEFAIAFFAHKSRFVFLQTVMALENKIPVLCLIHEDNYKDFPETLISYGEDFIQVKRYKNDNQLEENYIYLHPDILYNPNLDLWKDYYFISYTLLILIFFYSIYKRDRVLNVFVS